MTARTEPEVRIDLRSTRTSIGARIVEGGGDVIVALTRDFKATVRTRIATDPAFRKVLLREGIECLLSGDLQTGRAILRDYFNQIAGS